MKKAFCLLLLWLLLPISPAHAGIIFGQITGAPAEGTVIYVAYVNDNGSEILTEDGINPDAGTDQGYQGGFWRLDARNFSAIHKGDTVTLNFTDVNSERGKAGSVTVSWNGSFQNVGTIPFEVEVRPAPPSEVTAKATSPGVVWLNWPSQRRGVTYSIYRSTQASGGNNLASNGRYRLVASKVRPPYIDNTVPSVPGTQAWYLVIAEGPAGRKFGHSPEAYVPDTSLWLNLTRLSSKAMDEAIEVTWQLGQPLPIRGFHLYRSSEREGKYIPVNPELIQGSPFTEDGLAYRYVDESVDPQKHYFYYLEAVRFEGKAVKSAPLQVSSRPD